MRTPLDPAQRALIEENVPYARRFAGEQLARFQGLVQVFLEEKEFEGCGGLEITTEIRLIVAAQACVLLVGRRGDLFPRLRTILVYPTTYLAPGSRRHPDGTVSEGPDPRFGESWDSGAVVLAWDEVRRGAARHRDGRNVVYHEFAHQLDGESGTTDGAPLLPQRWMYEEWARVLGREFERLKRQARRGRPTVLDPYGAENPAEFFAVATETFFEKPLFLEARLPDLYEQLRNCYGQDPAGLAGLTSSPGRSGKR